MARPAADPALRFRKLRDTSIALPVLGLVLLMPPVAGAFALPLRIGGVPLIVVWVFAVWLALVLVARAVGRRLDRSAPEPPDRG